MSHPGPDLGVLLPAWSAVPFAGILLSIALFPLLAPKVWHHHYPKVSLLWGLALVVPFVGIYGRAAVHEILHMAIADYLPFIILLAALFTIGGGILVRGTLTGTPLSNTAILAIGTLVASFVGTTGAAMILVRPLLRANRDFHPRRAVVSPRAAGSGAEARLRSFSQVLAKERPDLRVLCVNPDRTGMRMNGFEGQEPRVAAEVIRRAAAGLYRVPSGGASTSGRWRRRWSRPDARGGGSAAGGALSSPRRRS